MRRRGNPNRKHFATFRRGGSSSSRLKSDCDIYATMEEIELFVAEKSSRSSDLSLLNGQLIVYGAKDEEVILTARTSKKATK